MPRESLQTLSGGGRSPEAGEAAGGHWSSQEGFLEKVEPDPALKEGFHSPKREERVFWEGERHE